MVGYGAVGGHGGFVSSGTGVSRGSAGGVASGEQGGGGHMRSGYGDLNGNVGFWRSDMSSQGGAQGYGVPPANGPPSSRLGMVVMVHKQGSLSNMSGGGSARSNLKLFIAHKAIFWLYINERNTKRPASSSRHKYHQSSPQICRNSPPTSSDFSPSKPRWPEFLWELLEK
ncbi:hypothetical protein AMTR_s00074p00173120 [Amborella trichopoda]|uniref:Uncharacterized protein n=1 Tax=Amborella trichopoda TaxID=13333 RepID=W1NM69_AMBTC|nr:hypothetical protein AMTR_s00074p00173120 [Amborella trichopoda]